MMQTAKILALYQLLERMAACIKKRLYRGQVAVTGFFGDSQLSREYPE